MSRWSLVTYYRELKPWMTSYEELSRRNFQWKWLAILARMLSSAGIVKDGPRRFIYYSTVEPRFRPETTNEGDAQ